MKRQCFLPIWSKNWRFHTSLLIPVILRSRQRHSVQFSPQTTQHTTNKKHTLKIVPVALHNHINNLFSGITKQLNNTYAIPKTTNLFMAGYRKDPPLLPRLPDNQPNFHRQSENIHTRDTHDTPLPKQRRNIRITETPTKPVTARFLSIPKDTKHNNHGKRHYPIHE